MKSRYTYKPDSRRERGAVSIFTVLMFAVLMSILSVGFVRLMMDEQQQTLQDDLSKSAYNAAQAGIEDAKRAMLHCETRPTPTDQADCKAQLYNPNCPGFNAMPNPAGNTNHFGTIGIPAATTSQTTVGDDETSQGYSCVIVTPNTNDLVGELQVDTANDSVMYELKTEAVFGRLTIEWHTSAVSDLKTQNQLNTNFNPRKGNNTVVNTNNWGEAPAVLRITLIKVPLNADITSDVNPDGTTDLHSTFVYPVSNPVSDNMILTAPLPRHFAQCTDPNPATGDMYACSVGIVGFADPNSRYYIVLKPLYRSAPYRITANDGAVPVRFANVEPSIDATGYTSGVYRRVQARVHLGSDIVSSSSGIEAGRGICKDFGVGAAAAAFTNSCP